MESLFLRFVSLRPHQWPELFEPSASSCFALRTRQELSPAMTEDGKLIDQLGSVSAAFSQKVCVCLHEQDVSVPTVYGCRGLPPFVEHS